MGLIPPGAAFNEGTTPPARARVAPFMNADRQMSGDLTVRFVARQDCEQWLPLWDGYNAFYGRAARPRLHLKSHG
jgi:hypothetical protein